jgi:nucleoid DNA-binding protein
MNKAELVATVQKSLGKGASKAQAERAVDAVIDGIKSGLKKGQACATRRLRDIQDREPQGAHGASIQKRGNR